MATQVKTEHKTREAAHARKDLAVDPAGRRVGKGPGQPPQLACRCCLQVRATQVSTESLEAMEDTLAELWIPLRRIGKGKGLGAVG